jgi:glucosamine--fructose-6-phosphate aminotransferase (isomerizing)
MTKFLRDILRQPDELQRTIDFLSATGRPSLDAAAASLRNARHIYLTGIGSSWHAALCAAPLFHLAAHPVYMPDASELLEFAAFPPDSVIIIISRSGRSIEIVNLLAKARQSRASVIAITNSADAPLAREAQIPIVVPIELDHAISVNTYSTLAATVAALASATSGSFDASLVSSLRSALEKTATSIVSWREMAEHSSWLAPGSITYFLARGTSLGSCNEARLLWEEGVKSPATALGTGSFRHGPQEMVAKGARFGMWIHASQMRDQDLAVARDLRKMGAAVMLIGQNLPADAGDLIFQLPPIPAQWQFLIDIIPVQIVAERLARLSGVDSDSFRFCSYIVEDEFGLLREEAGAPGKTSL